MAFCAAKTGKRRLAAWVPASGAATGGRGQSARTQWQRQKRRFQITNHSTRKHAQTSVSTAALVLVGGQRLLRAGGRSAPPPPSPPIPQQTLPCTIHQRMTVQSAVENKAPALSPSCGGHQQQKTKPRTLMAPGACITQLLLVQRANQS